MTNRVTLKLAVIAFFECVKQIRGGMGFAVVFHFFVTCQRDLGTVFQNEGVTRIFKIFLFNQYALKSLRIKAESRAAFQPLLIGIHVNIFELIVWKLRGHVGSLRNG